MALPAKNRLKKKKDFSLLFPSGRSIVSEHFSFRIAQGEQRDPICAIIVSNKTAPTAVTRNSVRRSISAIVQTLIPQSIPGAVIAITVRRLPLPDRTHTQEELVSVFRKSGILKQ